MKDYSEFGFEQMAESDRVRLEEKKKIRKASNLVGIVYIIVWFLPAVLATGLMDLTKIIFGGSVGGELLGDPAYLLFLQTVLSIAMFTAPFLIIPLRTGKKRVELMSLEKPRRELFLPLVLVGVGVSAFANIATSTVSSIFSGFGIEFLAPKIDYPSGFFGLIISVLAVAVTPALVEEFSMRGMVMGHLREFGDDFAILMSATVFAMIHGNLVQIPFAFIMGLIIGYAVVKTGSLITGIAIHFINNFASVILDMIVEGTSSTFVKISITAVYFAVCFLCGFIGLFLAKKYKSDLWEMDKTESKLSLGQKIGYFFSSPAIIVAIGTAVVDSLQMIYIS